MPVDALRTAQAAILAGRRGTLLPQYANISYRSSMTGTESIPATVFVEA